MKKRILAAMLGGIFGFSVIASRMCIIARANDTNYTVESGNQQESAQDLETALGLDESGLQTEETRLHIIEAETQVQTAATEIISENETGKSEAVAQEQTESAQTSTEIIPAQTDAQTQADTVQDETADTEASLSIYDVVTYLNYEIDNGYHHVNNKQIYIGEGETSTIVIHAKPSDLGIEDIGYHLDYNKAAEANSFVLISTDDPEFDAESDVFTFYINITGKEVSETSTATITICSMYDSDTKQDNANIYKIPITVYDAEDGKPVYINLEDCTYHYDKDCAGEECLTTTFADINNEALKENFYNKYKPCSKCVK